MPPSITGTHVWASALLFSQYLADNPSRLENKTIVELGAGCGLPGLTAYTYGEPKKVMSNSGKEKERKKERQREEEGGYTNE